MAQQYKVRPSEILGIDSEYAKYCFDQACMVITSNLKEEKIPRFEEDAKKNDTLRMMMEGLF